MAEGWGGLLVAGAVTALWLFLPGAAFLAAVRVRGLALAALAPVATVAMLAVVGLVLPLLGLPWSVPLVLVGSALLVAAAYGVRRLGVDARPLTLPRTRAPMLLAAVVAAQLLLAVLPFLLGMGGPGAILQWWDAMYHYSSVRFVLDTENASMLHIGGVRLMDDMSAYYPSGWHQVATLATLSLPQTAAWFRTAYTAACLVPFTVPFALGLAYAARAIFPAARFRAHLAVAVAAATTSVPLSIHAQHGSLPQALTLALLPAAIGGIFALYRSDRGRPGEGDASPFATWPGRIGALLVLGVLSLALLSAQPSGMLSLWLTILPLLGAHAVRVQGNRDASRGRRVTVWTVPATLVAVSVVAMFLPVADGAVEYDGSLHIPWSEAWRNLLLGWFQSWFTPWNAIVGVLGLAGVALALWRRHWVLVGAYALVALFFLDAATAWWPSLSALWYTDQKRLGVHLSILLILAAAELLGTLADRIATRWGGDTGSDRVRRAAAAVLAAVMLALGAAGVPLRTDFVREAFSNGPGTHVPLVTDQEIDMMAEVVPTLDPDGTIIGVPVAGTPFFYSLFGYSVEYRVAGGGMFLDQKRTNNTLRDWHGADRTACESAANLGSTIYVHQDERLYLPEYRIPWVNEVDVPGAVPIATTGPSTLLEIPDCVASR